MQYYQGSCYSYKTRCFYIPTHHVLYMLRKEMPEHQDLITKYLGYCSPKEENIPPHKTRLSFKENGMIEYTTRHQEYLDISLSKEDLLEILASKNEDPEYDWPYLLYTLRGNR